MGRGATRPPPRVSQSMPTSAAMLEMLAMKLQTAALLSSAMIDVVSNTGSTTRLLSFWV